MSVCALIAAARAAASAVSVPSVSKCRDVVGLPVPVNVVLPIVIVSVTQLTRVAVAEAATGSTVDPWAKREPVIVPTDKPLSKFMILVIFAFFEPVPDFLNCAWSLGVNMVRTRVDIFFFLVLLACKAKGPTD